MILSPCKSKHFLSKLIGNINWTKDYPPEIKIWSGKHRTWIYHTFAWFLMFPNICGAQQKYDPNTSLFCLFKVWEAADGWEKTNKSAANKLRIDAQANWIPTFYTTSNQPAEANRKKLGPSISWLHASLFSLSVHLSLTDAEISRSRAREVGAIRRVPHNGIRIRSCCERASEWCRRCAESTFCSPAGTADGKIVIWIGANRWGCNFSTTWTATKAIGALFAHFSTNNADRVEAIWMILRENQVGWKNVCWFAFHWLRLNRVWCIQYVRDFRLYLTRGQPENVGTKTLKKRVLFLIDIIFISINS